MNRYVILSREKSSYEQFSDMIRKNDPECRIMRVRDTSEAYNVARTSSQPICVIDIEHLAASDDFSGKFSPEEDGRLAGERLADLKRYITLNLDKHLSLEELAKKMYITPNYLSSIFRKYEKITLVNYIEIERMRKARFLLETERNRRVRDVGREVGYESCAYFSRTFKKHYGLTPLRYQKKYWQDKSALQGEAQRRR